jgi:hypothetical protein
MEHTLDEISSQTTQNLDTPRHAQKNILRSSTAQILKPPSTPGPSHLLTLMLALLLTLHHLVAGSPQLSIPISQIGQVIKSHAALDASSDSDGNKT